MNIFVAGASGAIGRRLIPVLIRTGHMVVGMTRSATGAEAIRRAGAEAVVVDALDGDAVMAAVRRDKPVVVVHQLTAIPPRQNLRRVRPSVYSDEPPPHGRHARLGRGGDRRGRPARRGAELRGMAVRSGRRVRQEEDGR
jgi:uncharacterized protein YbjT (DUF2867 family)